jgi:CMP-N,N'-diacetyllegionaminic acid synthase
MSKKCSFPIDLRALGVIPARGGSKSVPKKNVVDLCGKPLIAYTIEAARNSELLDDFIVSTDCDEIASVARAFGADTPFIRPNELSTDHADSLGVVLHALEFMENQNKTRYDAVVMLQPTTPFRRAIWIDEALRRLAENDLDSVVSVVEVGPSHPYRMYYLEQHDRLVPFVGGVIEPMMARQRLPSVYIRSGDIYATRRSCLIEQKSLIGSHSSGLVIDAEYAVNIDEPIDLEIARLKMRTLRGP